MVNEDEPDLSDRDDIRIYHELEQEGFFDSTPWETFIGLCLTFTEESVIPLTHDPLPQGDIVSARQFLSGHITESDLEQRRTAAWDRLKDLVGATKHIQRLTVIFLYPDLLSGIERSERPDPNSFLFINLLWDIDPSLPTDFKNFVCEN
ncbi:hypothetical protein CMUST_03235 [Corynebacterium mustelae]|uniref:Uncharacterized protein n=1 Tax=Corynebacterium mustelae TaxID=571915 RepID=A0A0G3GUX7_9CORY|nr:hypothetical protein [Corynebacterium mustelae]AKK04991.1 hypothetical protein CMUST_03235 [Corynebacterium mustelae]